MLRLLRIENFALIEYLEIPFRAGLNVLTGETGAGKSIILDALDAALGDRLALCAAAAIGAWWKPFSSLRPRWRPG